MPSSLPPLRTREYLILLALAERPLHGYALMKRVPELAASEIRVGPATLYRTLDHLEREGLIAPVEVDRDAKGHRQRASYGLTAEGEAALTDEVRRLEALARRGRSALAHGDGR